MDSMLSIFRVFDIAFFAPGTLLLAALLRARWIVWSDYLGIGDATYVEVANAVLTLLLIYVLGLLIHGLQRLISGLWGLVPATAPAREIGSGKFRSRFVNALTRGGDIGVGWYTTMASETRDDMATYFWYLRATCWNLALAVVLAAGLLTGTGRGKWWLTLASLLVALVLLRLGRDYDRALRTASKPECSKP